MTESSMVGEQFGNYRAISLLGEGGMGAVYLAEHPGIGRRVAVKVLHRNYVRDDNLLGRFLNEARAANAIRHPNIIEILDSGTIADGTPFLVMELLEGESLGARIRRVGALPIPVAVELAYQTASALGAAHKKGIVHRDLKPDNLYIVPDPHEPERERIKVLDFGIAKLQQGSAGDSVKTRTGTLMGTPIYMSPEQCRGTRTVDHRSDVYSLGVILFEMLTGQPPFVSEGFGELVNMHLNVAAPAPSSRNPAVPPALDAIVLRMLEKNADQRFADMADLQAALKSAGGTQFVVRGSRTSSPDLAGGTPPPAPLSNPKLGETTFSAGAGERIDTARSARPGRGASRSIAVMVGVAAAAVVAGVLLFRDGEKVARQREGQVPREAQPTTTALVPKDPPVPVAPAEPPAPRTVTVRVESDPPGASVVNAASGGVLGVTPVTLTRPRGGALKLRLEKDGFTPNAHDVALDDDQTIELTLEHKPKPRPHHPRPSLDDEPAKL
ncbi:MAG TPA: serine/threonine-protein kinase [Polyangia bacterium]|nr:serine/threonine-protein kinase [Polyangia bacterium]